MNTTPTPDPKPVRISSTALRAMSLKVREWTGWADATLTFGTPPLKVSRFAATDFTTRTVILNPEPIILNPHRVLNTITPFRLRQEAVMTGALLHEAGHARHSNWMPRTEEDAKTNPLVHRDGATPTKAVVKFARLMEEPRIEGIVAAEAGNIGAAGLDWTMRASAAHLVPMTTLHLDPDQQIMDLLTSWVLRAGRQVALHESIAHPLKPWVADFTSLLHNALIQRFTDLGSASAASDALQVVARMRSAITADTSADTGSFMIDVARDVLARVFPETDEPPMPSMGCGSGESADEDEESEESESEPGDEGEEGGEEATAAPESDDEGSKGEEDQSTPDEGSGEGEGSDSDETGEGEGEADSEGEPGDIAGEPSDTDTDTTSNLAQELADIERTSNQETKAESKSEAEDTDVQMMSVGVGGNLGVGGGWRNPKADEREVAKNASRFLRDLIDPSESSTVHLTESPSATVDGAALAAWKASGETRDPMFFRRTKRESMPTPPVQIAILVDISGSMDVLQKPSALLSWALASSALDLSNFAGRGTQVSSTLIHWGDNAKVIQPVGKAIPGIREVNCDHGTEAMHEAFDLIETQIPGFFDITDKPVNRLIVQFTDWILGAGFGANAAAERMGRALEAGVNMVTVAPGNYNPRWSSLSYVTSRCPIQRGRHTLVKYNPLFPEAVWDEAAKALRA